MGAEPTSGTLEPPDLSSLCLAITEHAPLAIATLEGATHIVRYGNPVFCRLMKRSMEQLVGKPFGELLPAKDQCVTLLERVFRTGKPESYTEQDPSKPHPVFWSYTIWPVRSDESLVGVMIQVTETAQFHGETVAMNEALMLGSLRQHELAEAAGNLNEQLRAEIDERKRAEEALRQSEAQARVLFESAEAARISADAARTRAETATRAKDEFLAALSHELRTPLNPALLLASSLVDDAELLPRVRSDIEIIGQAIALQAKLVDDLLDITRITGGKLRLELHPLDAHAALRHACEVLNTEAQERQIEITLDLAAPEHSIEADAVRIQQIFWNLLKNAVKFTAPGGVVAVRTGNAPEDKKALLIEIADTGVGIEPEMLGKIFDPFVQEEHAGARRFGGLGLGLAIARNLIELQNGRIRAQSGGRDQGATFFIELPLAAVSAPRAPDSSQPAAPAAPNQPARHILLVEDHELTRTTLARLLRRLGHHVAVAATAAQARELAGTKKCDLIISDLGLPDGDGHTLVTELRYTHSLPAIALSGYGMEEDLERSRKSGFFIHLVKPIDIHALKDAIAAAPLGEARAKS